MITQKFNKTSKFHDPGVGDFVLVRGNISHVVNLHLFLTRRGWGWEIISKIKFSKIGIDKLGLQNLETIFVQILPALCRVCGASDTGL